ncbi:MAG: hypothetical protein V3T23_07490 [Nitrososphaerales archaeon]
MNYMTLKMLRKAIETMETSRLEEHQEVALGLRFTELFLLGEQSVWIESDMTPRDPREVLAEAGFKGA